MKKKAKKTVKAKQNEEKLIFRERKLRDIPKKLNHPDPIPGFLPTLPGPPGWDSKMNPLGLKLPWIKK